MILPSRDFMPLILAALSRGQRVRLTANGGSMTPFIGNNDIVELEPIHSALTRADIVLARSTSGHYVIHRIVRVAGDSIWLRGDAQTSIDGPLPRRAVFGRVVTACRNGNIRLLDSGRLRLAGRVWIRIHPLGVKLLGPILFIRIAVGWMLRRLKCAF